MLCRCILLYHFVHEHLCVCLYIIGIVTSVDFMAWFPYVSWTEKDVRKNHFYVIDSLLRGR